MLGYNIAKTWKGKQENLNTKELNQYIKKWNPIWGNLSVNSTPWCAAIMGAWEREAGNKGTGSCLARSYRNYGTLVYDRDKKKGSLKDVKSGDIAVFTRGGSTLLGHVAYVDGIEISSSGTYIRTLGGNQGNEVCISHYPLERLLTVVRSP